jgi:hypothetical protein
VGQVHGQREVRDDVGEGADADRLPWHCGDTQQKHQQHNDDAEGVDTERAANIEAREQAIRMLRQPRERVHQHEAGMHEEEQHSQATQVEIVRVQPAPRPGAVGFHDMVGEYGQDGKSAQDVKI